ncbi:hypothetical protein C1646_751042 [Rhizophagus diaphanus]|nr:hypothetical protein C1646_751042 [Rhizophagus diaphanus] [Rhizophagus sp. MUCL 43196]
MMRIPKEWNKKKIKDADILYFEHSEFKDVEDIGKGGFGAVTNDEMQMNNGGLLITDFGLSKQLMELHLVHLGVCRRICGGYREEPVEGTLLEYSQLYQKCWDGEVIQISDVEDNEINSEEEELNERSDCITELDHELVTDIDYLEFEIFEDAVGSFHTPLRKVQCTLRVTINRKPRWKQSSINSVEIFDFIIYVDIIAV